MTIHPDQKQALRTVNVETLYTAKALLSEPSSILPY